jgi:hypothetical protein
MKKMKSLVAAFTLATAGMLTMGAAPAQAQSVPVYGGGDQSTYNQPASTGSAVSQGAVDDLAYNVGVQTIYQRAGKGFTQGTAQDGENIGLEFQLTGNNATVVRAYNLNDPNARFQFQQEVNIASANERQLADEEYRYNTRVYPVYEPDAFIICAPVRPIIGIGLIIGGWYPGYVPVYHHWDGFWDGYGHRHHGGGNHNTTIINNNTYINGHGGEHGGRGGYGGQWNGGGQNQWHNNQVPQQHVNPNQNPWGGAHDGRHGAVDNPVYHPPAVQQHVETRQAEPREPRQFEPRQAEPQRRFEVPQQQHEHVVPVQPRGQQAGGGAAIPGGPGAHHHR